MCMLENKNWLLEDEDFEDWYEEYGLDEETFEDDGWIDLRGCDLSSCLDVDDYESYMYEHGFDGFYNDPTMASHEEFEDDEELDFSDDTEFEEVDVAPLVSIWIEKETLELLKKLDEEYDEDSDEIIYGLEDVLSEIYYDMCQGRIRRETCLDYRLDMLYSDKINDWVLYNIDIVKTYLR